MWTEQQGANEENMIKLHNDRIEWNERSTSIIIMKSKYPTALKT